MPATASSISRPAISSRQPRHAFRRAGRISCFSRSTPERLGPSLKWETSRGGALFPHLYAPLDLAAVLWSEPLALGPDGRHVLPEGDRPRERAVRAWPGAAARARSRDGRMTRRQEPRAWALSARRRRRTTSALGPDRVRPRISQSGRHGGRFRQECARAAPASRHGLRLRRGGHADAAGAKRQSAGPAFFAPLADHAIINRLGFNNEGQAAALARLLDRPRGVVGVNIGAGRDSEDRIADYVSGIERMAQVASYLTINISSPNTPGLRDLQAPEALDDLLKRVQAARAGAAAKAPPLLVKLAPDHRRCRSAGDRRRDPSQWRRRHRGVEHHALPRGRRRTRRFRPRDRRTLGAAAVRPRDPHAGASLPAHAKESCR